VEKRFHHAWGHDVWVLVTTSVVRDDARVPLYMVTQVQDISERRELARRLEHVVDHDHLTGLWNRRHFEQELLRETERSARYGAPGRAHRHRQLQGQRQHARVTTSSGVARLLRHRLRQTDIIALGDEFAVASDDGRPGPIVADDVVRALSRETAVLADRSIHVTASIGVAMFDGLSDAEVLSYADLAMYEAKESGRNRVEMYRPLSGSRERVSARLAEADRIRRTLEEEQLILYCQPILDLRSNEVCHHELLVRLPDEQGGEPLLPSTFLYRAERSGLIQSMDAGSCAARWS
jgi:GGDEF domain-containing protein